MDTYVIREGSSMTDLYRTDERYERELKKIDEWSIHEKDKQLFINFLHSMEARGIGYVQLIKYILSMRTFLKVHRKPLTDLSREDLERFLIKMKHLKSATRQVRWYGIKKFYEYMGLDNFFFKVRFSTKHSISRKDILSKEDVEAMIETATSKRNKCIIALLWESGCRIGELLMLRTRDVFFDDYGAILLVSGKTGQRPIRIIEYVAELKSTTKDKRPDERIFRINYPAVHKMINCTAKHACIAKPVYPHLFRHSRASFLGDYLTEQQLNAYMGWTQGSRMTRIYVHMKLGKAIDETLLKLHGKRMDDLDRLDKLKKLGVG